ncbi:O-antigen ligase family protein [Priestia megaterium]|uniref:O-antigen ligase family protein n=1 Tax=Priestia megaterium TaxID=1404 RepID=UPI0020769F52|nr:O-antigen ligase family protein [Priestia megaterium]USD17469.1 O-antigen ligase family protein [Priestia megaterium]USD18560.1 O-antigen ligase family protein [Priestia megaterium]
MAIKFSQLFYGLIILYYGWFQVVFFQVPNGLLMLGTGMIGCIILDALMTKKNLLDYITKEIFLWFIFALTAFLFGIFLVENKSSLFSSILTFSQFLFLIYGIVYISKRKGTISFFVNIFIIFAVICALTTVTVGVEVGQGRISMGTRANPNSVGITMALGVGFILYRLDFKRFMYSIISLGMIGLLTYATLLTGSRKSLIAIILILIYWCLFVIVKDLKSLDILTKLKMLFLLTIVSIAFYYIIYPFFKDSVIFSRLLKLFEAGDETREGMYSEGFRFFQNNPIVGIGFNNYRNISYFGKYSHSTYIESLACTGIIGSILYFLPYLLLLYKYMKLSILYNLGYSLMKQSRVMLGIFVLLLFLGVGVIHFYEMTSSIAFGMLIAFCKINKTNSLVAEKIKNQSRKKGRSLYASN